MSENIDKPLTAREIFEKIAELQKQLTESSFHSLHRLGDSISSICTDENEEKSEQISEVCSVFKMRETTLLKMLALYEKMYDDLRPEKVDSDRVAILDTLIGTLGEGLTPMQTKEALVEILTTSL